ncbi:MAG: hypothetical protein WCJ30_23825, partial [Deltaproteobacteria bacterium]
VRRHILGRQLPARVLKLANRVEELQGRGYSARRVLDSLRVEVGVDAESDPAAQQTLVHGFASRHGLASRSALLGELLRVDFDERDAPELAAARSDPGLLRTRLREVFTSVLESWLAVAPLVVAIDDLQWLDRATLEAVGWALDALGGEALMVTGFGRPDSLDRFPDLWSASSPQRVEIGPLSDRASESLVRTMLGPTADVSAVRSIVTRAMGNPLFIEELLRARVSGDDAELPIAIQAAFQIRLDALAASTKRVALVSSVFGMSVWREAVRAVAPELSADTALAALAHTEILAERPRSRLAGAREYSFRHSLLRDAAYAMLLPDELGPLHRAAADWLVSAGERDDAVLARHYECAGEHRRATERYLAAARRAARESAYDIALAHAERGLALANGPDIAAELHLVAAVAGHPLGRYDEAIEHGERAMASTTDPAVRLEVVAHRGLTLRRVGQPERAREEIERALEDTRDIVGSPPLAHARLAARVELAWNHTASGRYEEAIEIARAAIVASSGDDHGLEALLLSAHHVLGRAQHGAGQLERALASHRVAVERAMTLGHRWRSEGARFGLGQVLLALGQTDEARTVLEAARKNARVPASFCTNVGRG